MALPCFNPKNPLAVKFRVGASPARESKEQSHAGRAPTIEGSSIGQSGFNQKNPSVFYLFSRYSASTTLPRGPEPLGRGSPVAAPTLGGGSGPSQRVSA